MKYWTVQSREVLDILNKQGAYQPDFKKSKYLQGYKDELYIANAQLYNQLLSYANQINSTNLNGLVFSFCKINDHNIVEFVNIDDFKNYIMDKKDVVYSLWKTLNKQDSVILELDFSVPFWNPLFIDLNDYQYLMPPVVPMPPYYTEDSEYQIHLGLSQGRANISKFPSEIAQAHLPYITVDMVKNVYRMFPI